MMNYFRGWLCSRVHRTHSVKETPSSASSSASSSCRRPAFSLVFPNALVGYIIVEDTERSRRRKNEEEKSLEILCEDNASRKQTNKRSTPYRIHHIDAKESFSSALPRSLASGQKESVKTSWATSKQTNKQPRRRPRQGREAQLCCSSTDSIDALLREREREEIRHSVKVNLHRKEKVINM